MSTKTPEPRSGAMGCLMIILIAVTIYCGYVLFTQDNITTDTELEEIYYE